MVLLLAAVAVPALRSAASPVGVVARSTSSVRHGLPSQLHARPSVATRARHQLQQVLAAGVRTDGASAPRAGALVRVAAAAAPRPAGPRPSGRGPPARTPV